MLNNRVSIKAFFISSFIFIAASCEHFKSLHPDNQNTSCQKKYSQLHTKKFKQHPQMKQPPKVALVLGAGGARGIAHVGVLEVLEKAGINIDLIIGCSAGSLVGSIYADDPNSARLKKKLITLKRSDLFNLSFFKSPLGFASGDRIKNFFSNKLKARKFSQLKIPFIAVATDLVSGELVSYDQGDLIPPLLGSTAYPIVFSPVPYKDKLLADGGIISPLPTMTALDYQAQIVIAVDLTRKLKKEEPTSLVSVIKRSIEISYYNKGNLSSELAHVIIKPSIGKKSGTFDDSSAKEHYYAGKKAAQKALPFLLSLLKK